jgi:hypothetical protein
MLHTHPPLLRWFYEDGPNRAFTGVSENEGIREGDDLIRHVTRTCQLADTPVADWMAPADGPYPKAKASRKLTSRAGSGLMRE